MLKGKTALVTGASKGIGKAIAIALAKEGCNVIFNYVDGHGKPTLTRLTDFSKVRPDGTLDMQPGSALQVAFPDFFLLVLQNWGGGLFNESFAC